MAVLCISLTRWSLETWHLAAVSVTFQTLSKRWRTTDLEERGSGNSGSCQVTVMVHSMMSLHCSSSKLWITRLHSSRRTAETLLHFAPVWVLLTAKVSGTRVSHLLLALRDSSLVAS